MDNVTLQVVGAVILLIMMVSIGLSLRALNKANLLFTHNCRAQKSHADIAAKIFAAQSVDQAEACNKEIDKFYNTFKDLINYKDLQTLTCSLDGLIHLQVTVILSTPKTKAV